VQTFSGLLYVLFQCTEAVCVLVLSFFRIAIASEYCFVSMCVLVGWGKGYVGGDGGGIKWV
jgi:hypothetical protein